MVCFEVVSSYISRFILTLLSDMEIQCSTHSAKAIVPQTQLCHSSNYVFTQAVLCSSGACPMSYHTPYPLGNVWLPPVSSTCPSLMVFSSSLCHRTWSSISLRLDNIIPYNYLPICLSPKYEHLKSMSSFISFVPPGFGSSLYIMLKILDKFWMKVWIN